MYAPPSRRWSVGKQHNSGSNLA
uniref:Uncharacterized protein n=1 Tax=Arundo donax TaxID=35708 RepID=A0A0A9ETG5_ARUDO